MPMLQFCGFDVELTVDRVLRRDGDCLSVFSAHDEEGDQWLICGLPGEPGEDRDLTWICAPASSRTVELVTSGLAAATDALRHSSTGWVEVVRVRNGHAVPDQRLPCSGLQMIGLAALPPDR